MKAFSQRELREAYAYAASGGQALHLMSGRFAYLRKDTPSVFKGRDQIAHLFDQNEVRLIETARRLGVRVIKVERRGTPQQHIDLCAGPLDRALRIVGAEINQPPSTATATPPAGLSAREKAISIHDDTQIVGFFGAYRWLSNFHECPMVFEGDRYGSSEAAYQAAKFPRHARAPFFSVSPMRSKTLAREILGTPSPEARALWDAQRDPVMEMVVMAKFQQNANLGQALVGTGARYLEEANWWGDVHFGTCRGRGVNALGTILMKTRAKLGGAGVVSRPSPQGELF